MVELGTLWLLHYRLASNLNEATAWYYFFNVFKRQSLHVRYFSTQLKSFLRIQDEEVSERSIDDDYMCTSTLTSLG
jgi:hypothetical protein